MTREHASRDPIELVKQSRILYWSGAFVAFIAMLILSVQGDHVASAIGLTLVTAGVLVLTPQIGDALASKGIRTRTRNKLPLKQAAPAKSRRKLRGPSVRVWGWITLGVAALGLAALALGINAGSGGRLLALAGLAVMEVGILGGAILWTAKALKEVSELASDEQIRTRITELQEAGVPELIGGSLFILGTLIQFVLTLRH
jgi:hypothetical protein